MLDRRLKRVRITALGLGITLSGCSAEQGDLLLIDLEAHVNPGGATDAGTTSLDATTTTSADASRDSVDSSPSDESKDAMDSLVYARIRSVQSSPDCSASVVTDADGDSAVAISSLILQTSPKERRVPGFCSLTMDLDLPDNQEQVVDSVALDFDTALDEGSGFRVQTMYDFFDPAKASSQSLQDVLGPLRASITLTPVFERSATRECGRPVPLVLTLLLTASSRGASGTGHVELQKVGKLRVRSRPCQPPSSR